MTSAWRLHEIDPTKVRLNTWEIIPYFFGFALTLCPLGNLASLYLSSADFFHTTYVLLEIYENNFLLHTLIWRPG